ncbi:MAG: isocitrate/isopropylmalate dehydrogenase family protein [Deltaproteobacteria bacterium]|nr:isocitrate/isopropylmalate dehydrogenase family protein [Deltaproteobacteria bacterium]MBK8235889.1 isocitrate/isopropylmalate dehydrogenase family protein [Deltaproteobacteria bacterium]MBP7289937.1 isocitrate/isopropylmalate dehydrogenase family protein [Nannocystaceae bacterium]
MAFQLVTLPGDGTGPEVMREGMRVLDAVSRKLGIEWKNQEIPCGGQFYLQHGSRDWPEGSEEACAAADLILLGAVGWPDPKGSGGPVLMANGKMAGYSPVIGNRIRLNLYANVRPVKLYQGVRHRIHGAHKQVWEPGKVDIVFLRENTEGMYAQTGGKLSPGGRTDVAIDTRVITRRASEQIIRHAFELCRARPNGAPKDGKKRVTAIVKDNVLHGCQFFRDVFFEIGAEYPEIEKETAIVDAFTQWLLGQPEHYDVCVTTNMFGDIVTDLASVLQGGMGMAVGANVGREHGMFEPIHGSAPKHAGKDKVNPIAMILAVKEGLDWLGHRKHDERLTKAATAIEAAVVATLQAGKPLTYDIAGEAAAAKCSEVGKAIADRAAALV